MRAITHGDVSAAARAVWSLPTVVQPAAVRAMLEKAHAADRFRKNCGRAHPLWGTGSLMAAALTECGRAGEPRLSDSGYLEAMCTVIETILDWRQRAR